jgi:RNA polymerase sigma-70 factor (ECF subfamily)
VIEHLLQHRDKLLAYVRRRVSGPELAEDIFQEALLRALRQSPAIVAEEQLLAWFYRVLRNAVIDSYRREAARTRHLSALAPLAAAAMPADLATEPELCECFRALLPTLRPEYRDMIESLELGTESPEAAAARLGIDRNNLKVRRFRARRQLRQRLEETCRTCADHGCLDCTCKRG